MSTPGDEKAAKQARAAYIHQYIEQWKEPHVEQGEPEHTSETAGCKTEERETPRKFIDRRMWDLAEAENAIRSSDPPNAAP